MDKISLDSSADILKPRLIIQDESDCPLLTPSSSVTHDETPSSEQSSSIFINQLINNNKDLLNQSEEINSVAAALSNLNSENGIKAFMDSVVNSNNNKINDESSSRDPMVESSSDSNCSEQNINKEPVCTQLLTQLNTAYQHLAPDAQAIFCSQENGGKPPLVGGNAIQLVMPKTPKDYEFTRWNWVRIRQVCFWGMICLLTITTTFAIRGIVLMPRRCDPSTEWWQGKLFYEIFPASFQDSSKIGDGIGDLQGINTRVNYLKNLGVKAVHLNSIFPSEHYPEHYSNILSLTSIDENLGRMSDFENLLKNLHRNNMKLIIDLPVHYFTHSAKEKVHKRHASIENATDSKPKFERYISNNLNNNNNQFNIIYEITKALKFWRAKQVDGFYLKDLEHHINNNTYIIDALNYWRNIIESDKILMCHWKVLKAISDNEVKTTLIRTMNLIDVTLNFGNGTQEMKKQIDEVISSQVFGKLNNEKINSRPWIHWSTGGIERRLINNLGVQNASFAATVLSMMLPGTPSLFYGDEIGMGDCACEDHNDLEHLHSLPPMPWQVVLNNKSEGFSMNGMIFPWLPASNVFSNENAIMEDSLGKMIRLRQSTAPIFSDTAKRHELFGVNCEVKYARDELIIIERWYTRQNTYIYLGNFGNTTHKKDFSSFFYEGRILVGPLKKINQTIHFKEFTIAPGEAFVIQLEK
ncbi:neutral and basic amino acid transport protein rBAT isoform X1 [Microplitis demolitor]|uniref:neutral and basic amino acid transport protein rBAT isoform X1 n=2 Tax=Microplitis demolitor TaxID=69319 RepID=UPI00235B6E90|nr:neutral and basic amino acid transport protein rBAT isoform X1 [Microplitis demolitor]XP_053596117.1 neutral and basic amino acid transport protein rBAT isoform X1 [Microplitis demolitor]XP_053596118.1 neutral and basic amino acid transport protein rBAT isoform X1 [Microplitis demolitor]